MIRYILGRLVLLVISMWLATFITFLIFVKLPSGNPAIRLAGRAATPETVAAVAKVYGLNDPLWVQYWRFLRGSIPWPGWFLNPTYFYSYVEQSSVRALIWQRLPVTVVLVVGAAVIWLALSLALGTISALKPRSIADRSGMLFVLAGVSAPGFWVAYLFLWLFWYRLHLLPGSGLPPGEPLVKSILAGRFVMPWVALALGYAAFYTRMIRLGLLQTLRQDYVRTAEAKGLQTRKVVIRHALPATLPPVLSILALDVGGLVGGVIIIETVFNLPGLGQYTLSALLQNDFPSVMGLTVVASLFIMVANLIVDVLYTYIDPRIRLG